MSKTLAKEILRNIPKYPDSSEPNFIYDTTEKKEFYDFRLSRSEPTPEDPGELLQTQKFIKRFFAPETPNQAALLFHGLGSGKCVSPLTLIPTSKGVLTAEQVWNKFSGDSLAYFYDQEQGTWSKPQEEVTITSFCYEKEQFITAPINFLYKQSIDENIVEVQLDDDSKISITLQHHLYSRLQGWTTEFELGMDIGVPRGDNLHYAKIKSINIVRYKGFVYDMEVSVHHNYVANGILCHNSCTSSAVVENFKNIEVGGKRRKPAIVLVGNGVLRDGYIKQIAEVCTSGVYTPKTTTQERRKGVVLTEDLKFKRVKRAVAETYRIVTFGKFLKNLPADDDVLREEYKDRVVIIDEAHSFRIQPKKRPKKSAFPTGKQPVSKKTAKSAPKSTPAKDKEEATPAKKEKEIDPSTSGVDAKTYQQLHRFLHLIAGSCRILLLTGTPIWDQSSEIASLMNLILPLDQQLPTGKDFDRTFFDIDGNLIEGPDTTEVLKSAFRGRVSYLRQMMTTAKREEMGTKDPFTKYVTVYPDQMSKWQAEGAEEAWKTAVKIKKTGKSGKAVEVEGGEFAAKAREAANMIIPVFGPKDNPRDPKVYPDYAYGTEAFKKYAVTKAVNVVDKTKSVSLYGINDPKIKIALTENLEKYSAVFASIISDALAHPDQVTFIYNERVTGTGGAIMQALCMQLHGFQWIRNASEIANPGKRRFAVITNDPQTTHLDGQISKLLESANEPSNAHAERLQIIIGSEKISLGITIKNVRRVHIVMPHWNIPSIEQAQARGFRFGSHDALKPEERTIQIFKHVAVEGGKLAKGAGFPKEAGFSDKITIDVQIYRRAEEKEHKNTQIYRLMKTSAFDCALFYKRNVLAEDVDYTRDCDYQECEYTCDTGGFSVPAKSKGKSPGARLLDRYAIPLDKLDYSTANLFYSAPKIKELVESIIKLFGSYFSLRIEAVKELLALSDAETSLLMTALENIIANRVAIRNRYGFLSYLKESNNIVFLDDSLTAKASYPNTTYVENPLVSEATSMDFLVEILELEHDRDAVEKFCRKPSAGALEGATLAHNTKIVMLEAVFTLRENGSPAAETLAATTLLEHFDSDIYAMRSDGIAVHILYTEEFKGVAYDVAAKLLKPSGMMRWYDSEEQRWRFVDDHNREVEYIAEIRAQLGARKTDEFEGNEYGVYGTIAKRDGAFRIITKLASGKSRGKKCETWPIGDLIDLFVVRLKDYPPVRADYAKISKEELVAIIKGRQGFDKFKIGVEKKNEKQLRGLLTLMTMSIEELCAAIREWLGEHELLFTV